MFFGTRTFCLLGNKNFLFFGTRTFLAFPYCLSFVVVILWQQDLSFLWHKNFLFFGTRTFRAARINLSCVPCFFGNRTFRFLVHKNFALLVQSRAPFFGKPFWPTLGSFCAGPLQLPGPCLSGWLVHVLYPLVLFGKGAPLV